MSNPPKYASTVDDEESVGLLPSNPHLYPPAAAASGSSDGAARSVVYLLRAKWPVTDIVPHQQAVSSLGKSREETVQLVHEAFPDLQQIDDSRLEFYVPLDPAGTPKAELEHYARITGPAWANLHTATVRIGVADAVGEKERRRRKNCNEGWMAIGAVVTLTLLMTLVIVFLTSREAANKKDLHKVPERL